MCFLVFHSIIYCELSIVKTTIELYLILASLIMAVPPSVADEVDTQAELKALAECFDKLTWALPLDDITPKLISKRVLSFSVKQEIAAESSDRKKVAYFLEHCIQKPLSIGDRTNFDHLMEIMKENKKAAFLVDELEKQLAPPEPPPASEMQNHCVV